jgi:membrane-bound lytic murein transglycosylase D
MIDRNRWSLWLILCCGLVGPVQAYDLGWMGERAQPSLTAPAPTDKLETLISSMDKPYFDNLWDQLAHDFDLAYPPHHPRVRKVLGEYRNQAYHFAQVTARAEPYLYFIVDELRKRQMPLELALLPMVESSYEITAKSSSSAAGLWQFIPLTAKDKGLSMDQWYDARKDIYASTQAALDYLTYLNQRFDGDWLLALAAYNAGGGTVSRAIKQNADKGRKTDYWSLKLPEQTLRYVPKFLALIEVVKNARQWNLPLQPITNAPSFGKFLLKEQLELSWVAKVTDLSLAQVTRLNPAYKRGVTHPEEPHYLFLPQSALTKLSLALTQHTAQAVRWQTYQVKPGDTFWRIAQIHQVPMDELIKVNTKTPGPSSPALKTGEIILIPKPLPTLRAPT